MQFIIDLLPPEFWLYAAKVPFIWYVHTAFACWLMLCAYAFQYGIRRYLGHEKFKGRWYNASQIQLLKQELYEGVRQGRIPDSQTMAFLDRHIYGKESEIRRLNGNGWL